MKMRSRVCGRRWPWLGAVCATGLLCLAAAGTGCSESNGGYAAPRRMVSSKEFDRGRADGRRDARASWTDDNAAWLWLWMTDDTYQQGYRQGWNEGRAQLKLNRLTTEAD